jgi:hypothetical protein
MARRRLLVVPRRKRVLLLWMVWGLFFVEVAVEGVAWVWVEGTRAQRGALGSAQEQKSLVVLLGAYGLLAPEVLVQCVAERVTIVVAHLAAHEQPVPRLRVQFPEALLLQGLASLQEKVVLWRAREHLADAKFEEQGWASQQEKARRGAQELALVGILKTQGGTQQLFPVRMAASLEGSVDFGSAVLPQLARL